MPIMHDINADQQFTTFNNSHLSFFQKYWEAMGKSIHITESKAIMYFVYLYQQGCTVSIFKTCIYAVKYYETVQNKYQNKRSFKDNPLIKDLLEWV